MTTAISKHPEQEALLTASEAARELRIGLSTLNKMRIYGGGPVYVKIGSRVRYRRSDLHQWVAGRLRRSTSVTLTEKE